MAVKIVPAVLARTAAQLRTQWSLARAYGQIVHLDLADGTLVPGRTVGVSQIAQLDQKQPVEIHAMTRRPDRWLNVMLRLRLRRVILHVELGASLRPYLALFRSHRIPVALAINPATSLARLQPWTRLITGIQVMGVEPGRLAAPWKPRTVDRAAELHRRYPRLALSCDGGMTPTTIPLVGQAGVTSVVVGSFFQRNPDPAIAWEELQRAGRA